MLTCLTCSKQRREDGEDEEEEDGPRQTKDAVKTLTSQMKDMALKVSGSSSSSSSKHKKASHLRSQPEFDAISEGIGYDPGSSSSTPAWDFKRRSYHHHRPFSRFSVSSSQLELEDEEDVPREWTAQVEPGVQITFLSLPRAGNDLKRIRFSREMFDKFQAQRWWGENFDRIMELYNVQKFNQQSINTPGRSEDGRDSTYSRFMMPSANKDWAARCAPQGGPPEHYYDAGPSRFSRGNALEASRPTTSSMDEPSVSTSSTIGVESEWIEEDEPGVYITIRQLMDGSRELRRVRFSRERFEEDHAKNWWETNRDRIQAQYLC